MAINLSYLSQFFHFSQARDYGDTFLEWWFEELRGMRLLGRPQAVNVVPTLCRLTLGPDQISISLAKAEAPVEEILLPYEGDLAAGLEKLIAEWVGIFSSVDAVEFYLPDGALLERSLVMPAASQQDIRDAVFLQVSHLMPLRTELVEVAMDVALTADEQGMIQVRLGLVTKELLSSYRQALRRFGPDVSVFKAGSKLSPGAGYEFQRKAISKNRQFWKKNGLLLICAGFLSVALVFLEIRNLTNHEAMLAKKETELAVQASVVTAEKIKLEKFQKEADLVLGNRKEANLSDVLGHLSQEFPDNTWVFDLNMRREGISLVGETADVSHLTSLIEKSPHFTSLKSQTTFSGSGAKSAERFQILLKVRGK
jgi:hypothetical protein